MIASAFSYAKRQAEADHWHRTENDPGRASAFTDAATLIEDFFAEVERILRERGVSIDLVTDEPKTKGTRT